MVSVRLSRSSWSDLAGARPYYEQALAFLDEILGRDEDFFAEGDMVDIRVVFFHITPDGE